MERKDLCRPSFLLFLDECEGIPVVEFETQDAGPER